MMTLTVFLMTAPPEVTCVSELLTPSIAVFTRGLQAEESSTLRLQTLKTAMPIAAAAHPLIAAPFIHALGAPRIFIGPDGLPPIMLVTYQRTPLPPPPLPPFIPNVSLPSGPVVIDYLKRMSSSLPESQTEVTIVVESLRFVESLVIRANDDKKVVLNLRFPSSCLSSHL